MKCFNQSAPWASAWMNKSSVKEKQNNSYFRLQQVSFWIQVKTNKQTNRDLIIHCKCITFIQMNNNQSLMFNEVKSILNDPETIKVITKKARKPSTPHQ